MLRLFFSLLLSLVLMVPALAAPHGMLSEAIAAESNDAEFLEPDQAFKLDIKSDQAGQLKATFTIAPGHYLYKQRISFSQDDTQLEAVFPKPEIKQDPNFGESEVYHHNFDVLLKLNKAPSGNSVTINASYQGCSEKGLCYPPIQKAVLVDAGVQSQALQQSTNASVAAPVSENQEISSLLKGGHLWLVVLGFFGFGLLLSLTPCVFPMIPILSGIIVGQGQQQSRMHSFNLSVAYTLGMAISYTIAGVIAGLSGQLISAALQNPWVLGSGAFVFVLLSLSMFGFYELQLPSAMESGVLNFTNRIKGGRFFGVFVMGVLSALIVSPCVAAPLAGALLYIGQTHDVVLGGVALFFLSLGMGVPLLIVGASAGALLPRAGRWMESVKNFFGVMMLGMAIWLVSPVIPVVAQMLLWAALLIVSSIYLHALDALPENKTNWSKFWKGIGVIMLLFGVSLMIGALSGSKNPLQPFAAIHAVEAKERNEGLVFKRFSQVTQLQDAIAAAKGQPVMLDFYADWCTACKEYEEITFQDKRVKNALANTVLLQLDVTGNTSEQQALMKQYGIFGPPAILFFDGNGQHRSSADVMGYQSPEKFLVSLQRN